MERQEIVKIFLDKGFMIDNESLDFFSNNQSLVQPFFDSYYELKNKTGSINLAVVHELLKIKPSGIQILKVAKKKNKISVADQSSFLNRRYESIRKVMNGRLDLINLVSINKISQRSKKFSLIGIVKEKNDETKSLVLEDTTGTTEIFFSENFLSDYNSILHDDILGFICSNEFGRCNYLKTVWPDIPLSREVKKAKESHKCIFASISNEANLSKLIDWLKKSIDDKTSLFLFTPTESDHNIRQIIKELPTVEKYHIIGTSIISFSNLTFFLSTSSIYKKYQDFFNATPDVTLINLLKRRSMNPSMDFDRSVYEEDPFVLAEIPDVVAVSSFNTRSVSNYKGTNILALEDFSTNNSALIFDSKTREVINVKVL